MWPATGRRDGIFYFDNQPYLRDQFLANKKPGHGRQPAVC
jgi:hypothetical protein